MLNHDQHDHSENGTYRLTIDERTVLIYPDGCRQELFEEIEESE